MTANWHVLVEISWRTALIYACVLLGLRLSGKREIGQLTPFDLVVLLLISNAVQNAMTGPDTTVSGGLAAAGTILVLNYFVALLRMHFAPFRRFVEGVPVILISHGQMQHANLRKERITPEELEGVLRKNSCDSVAKVELAMLEIDGSVSVIRRDTSDALVASRTKFAHKRHRS